MPARRTRKFKQKKRKTSRRIKQYILILVLAAAAVIVFLSGERWDKSSRLTVAIQDNQGDIVLSTFDPNNKTISNVTIPADTEVIVARGLGVMRAKNVMKLGESEGIGGNLLAETVTRYFTFPTHLWAKSEALGLSSRNIYSAIKSVMVPYPSNLSFITKIQMVLFSFGVKDSQRQDINLGKTSYLSEQNLKDGDRGYVVATKPANSIVVLYTDDYIANNLVTVSITDATGESGVAGNVGRVLEALGAKTAVIKKENESKFDCKVSSSDEVLVMKISRLLKCEVRKSDSNFDVEVLLGTDFSDRY